MYFYSARLMQFYSAVDTLAVEGKMIGILGDEDVCDEPGAWPAALDRAAWQRGLLELLAAAAGHTRPDNAIYDEPAGDVLELFGDVLANALELAATGVAGRTGIKDMLLAGEMIRQWPAGGLLSCLGRGCARWRPGAAENLEIFKHQLELIEAFGRGAEAIAQLLVQPRAELRDHKIAQARIGCVSCDDGILSGDLRVTLGDDRLERFNIIRQI
jgi:hypothetical protein